MGVSRLDRFTLANAQTATGYAASTNQYIGPVNGLVSFLVSGTNAGLSLSFEVYDGANWVPVSGITVTANGTATWQGAALGIRSKVGAITSGNVTVVAVFAEYL